MTALQNKNKKSPKKEKHSLKGFLLVMGAFVVAVGIHVGLFAAFDVTPSPPPSQERGRHKKPPSVLLTPPEFEPYPWEKRLWWRAHIQDPRLMSQPDEDQGFSSVLKKDIERSYTPPPAYTFEAALRKPEYPEVALMGDYPTLLKKLSRSYPPLQISVPDSTLPSPLPQKVVWRKLDGTVIPSPPSLPISERYISQLLQDTPAHAPTVLEIRRERNFARVLVRESSGNMTLDRIAHRVLKRELRYLPENTPVFIPDVVPPPYVPPPGEQQRLEVEWRLLQSTEYADNTQR